MVGVELGQTGLMQIVTVVDGLSLAPNYVFVYLQSILTSSNLLEA